MTTKFACGHDKSPENSKPKMDGRGRHYPQCRTCYNAYQAKRKARIRADKNSFAQPTMAERARKFPVEPLLDHVRRRILNNAEEQALDRARRAGELTLLAADKVAVALGTHPGLIWPDWFEMEESA